MADSWGYAVLQTDRPGSWLVDGYATVIDGYGTLSLPTVPSGIVKSIVRNSTGNYSLILQEAWYALLSIDVKSMIPSTLSPAYVGCQLEASTIGSSTVLPISAGGAGQSVTFQFNVAGTPTELPKGSGLLFLLVLKQSSA
jgi:hypothetical protein